MDGAWLRSAAASQHFGVHANTLRRWADSDLVKYKTTVGGQRVYLIGSEGTSNRRNEKETIIYIRVSTSKQKDDLERQQVFALSKYPNARVVKDIGSGLNFKRRNLLKLLDSVDKGLIQKVVVTSKDRLCRFGYEWLQWFFSKNDTELVVLDHIDKSPEQEFTEDILAILQVFACRWNGRRNYSVKKQENQIAVDITPNQST